VSQTLTHNFGSASIWLWSNDASLYHIPNHNQRPGHANGDDGSVEGEGEGEQVNHLVGLAEGPSSKNLKPWQ
jgi:hypothetical protein